MHRTLCPDTDMLDEGTHRFHEAIRYLTEVPIVAFAPVWDPLNGICHGFPRPNQRRASGSRAKNMVKLTYISGQVVPAAVR